ncbi:hypothetical protein SERLA73DRAFT_172531 [Serpula lacrymans var. lacrymans S7.3]|uniref:Uncharacterized protein n=1 Tax=Serpula lacrymans var. lacrymans (strain S7.3) TaxID=936435 RepID=F8QFM8_SERL3|nr:hypothetical protein SERLA73DRAFT_172531 [Serpula lacrymans var. lacrymans S7.3]
MGEERDSERQYWQEPNLSQDDASTDSTQAARGETVKEWCPSHQIDTCPDENPYTAGSSGTYTQDLAWAEVPLKTLLT